MISAFVITTAILAFISTLSIIPTQGVSATTSGSSKNHHFIETFDVDSAEDALFDSASTNSGRWKKSKAGKYANQAVQVAVPAASVDGFESDKALILDVANKHYGIFHEFSSPIVATKGKDLIIQYEVRLEEQHTCGGAYLKFPRAQAGVSLSNLDNDTPYSIMFGPDKCGSTNKVHFIVQVQNPVTKKWKEHHLKEVLSMANDKRTHLYGVHVKPNGSFDLYLDNKLAKSGSLSESMDPPIQPPTTVDDPSDIKPSSWLDDPNYPDPEAVKPEDWDEEAPKMIVDEAATKPSSWLDDAPLKISDPEAVKPEDWDDEEDGEFVAPEVDNPACAAAAGCGEWKRPLIKNPAFKGMWKAPLIPNPDYKGPWKARQISNPDYYEVTDYSAVIAPISAVAIEVWTVNRGVAFDNIYIGESISDAKEYATKTFDVETVREKAFSDAKTQEEVLKAREKRRMEGTGGALEASVADFIDYTFDNPLTMIGAFIGLILSIVFLCYGGTGTGSSKKLTASKPSNTPTPPPTEGSKPNPSVSSKSSATTAATADADDE